MPPLCVNRVLQEKVEFTMSNTHLEGPELGNADGTVNVKLRPGEKYALLLQVHSPGDLWSATYTRHLSITDAK